MKQTRHRFLIAATVLAAAGLMAPRPASAGGKVGVHVWGHHGGLHYKARYGTSSRHYGHRRHRYGHHGYRRHYAGHHFGHRRYGHYRRYPRYYGHYGRYGRYDGGYRRYGYG